MSGFVYIMSNPSFSRRLYKIGKSDRDPTIFRKEELFTTGLPEPFTVEYFAFVEDPEKTEREVHGFLSDHRVNRNREFFDCDINIAIAAIKKLSNIKYEEFFFEIDNNSIRERVKNIQKEERRKIQSEEARRKYYDYQNNIQIKERSKMYFLELAKNTLHNWNDEYFKLIKFSTQDESTINYLRDLVLVFPIFYKTIKTQVDDSKINKSTIHFEIANFIDSNVNNLNHDLDSLDKIEFSEWVSLFIFENKIFIQRKYKDFCISKNISIYINYLWNDLKYEIFEESQN